MSYFSYHRTAKKLILENKLLYYYLTDDHNGIKPALVLVFNDNIHPIMPIRIDRFEEYSLILPKEKFLGKK